MKGQAVRAKWNHLGEVGWAASAILCSQQLASSTGVYRVPGAASVVNPFTALKSVHHSVPHRRWEVNSLS